MKKSLYLLFLSFILIACNAVDERSDAMDKPINVTKDDNQTDEVSNKENNVDDMSRTNDVEPNEKDIENWIKAVDESGIVKGYSVSEIVFTDNPYKLLLMVDNNIGDLSVNSRKEFASMAIEKLKEFEKQFLDSDILEFEFAFYNGDDFLTDYDTEAKKRIMSKSKSVDKLSEEDIKSWKEEADELGILKGYAITNIELTDEPYKLILKIHNNVSDLSINSRKEFSSMAITELKELEKQLFNTELLNFEFEFEDGSHFLKE